MGLCRQFAQRHFCTFHGFTLGAESRVTQAWGALSPVGKITTGETIPPPLTHARLASLCWTARTFAGATIAATGCGSFGLFLAWAVIPAHGHHLFGWLGRCHGCSHFCGWFSLGSIVTLGGLRRACFTFLGLRSVSDFAVG